MQTVEPLYAELRVNAKRDGYEVYEVTSGRLIAYGKMETVDELVKELEDTHTIYITNYGRFMEEVTKDKN